MMVRRLRSWIAAVFVLSALLAWIEVGQRIHDAASRATQNRETLASSLNVVPSATMMWELKPTSGQSASTEASGWGVNSHGCRGPEIAVPKSAGAYRLIGLGGERILAPQSPEAETFTAVLQQRMSPLTRMPVDVVNAGQSQGSPLTVWLRSRRELAAWQPDVCVLVISLTDWLRDAEIRRYLICDAQGVPVSAAHPATATRTQANPLDVWRRELKTLDWCWQQAPWCRASTTSGPPAIAEQLWTKSGSQISELQSGLEPLFLLQTWCDSLTCRLLVFVTPEPWELSPSATNAAEVRQWAGVPRGQRVSGAVARAWVIRSLRERHIEAVDMTAAFPQGKAADPLFHPAALEWTAQGNAFVAERVMEYITQRVPGPWSNEYFRQPIVPASASVLARPE